MLIGFVTACTQQSTPSTKNEISSFPLSANAIVGGLEVSENDLIHRHVVGLYDSVEGQICSGTLISESVVLTAAHCVGIKPSAMFVFFGTEIGPQTPLAPVDKIEVSPYWKSEFSRPGQMGDLALVHFVGKKPITYHPAELLPREWMHLLSKNSTVTVAGYGVSDGLAKTGARILRQAEVLIANPAYGSSEILVDQSRGQGVCHGDSGGPAFITINGTAYVWGVTSRGIGTRSNDCNHYAAMTSTLAHRTWILRMNLKLSSPLIQFEWGDDEWL